MELYILRHAIAETATEAGVSQDAERPLSREGRDKMKRIAEAMRAMGVEVDLILSSPYLRARDTALIAHDGLGLSGCLQFTPALASGQKPDFILAELKERFAKGGRIMIVGHEPDLSGIISRITAQGRLQVEMKKAGLAKISIATVRPELSGTLEYLLPPKVMLQLK
jgi:phosphohistidine phosphatase